MYYKHLTAWKEEEDRTSTFLDISHSWNAPGPRDGFVRMSTNTSGYLGITEAGKSASTLAYISCVDMKFQADSSGTLHSFLPQILASTSGYAWKVQKVFAGVSGDDDDDNDDDKAGGRQTDVELQDRAGKA